MTPPHIKEKIIVALDSSSLEETQDWVRNLAPYVGYFKVGLELLTAHGAPRVVGEIHRLGGKIFFDGKFNDIPNTTAGATAAVATLGVEMFDVHAASGVEAMKAAVAKKGKAKALAITVLTSLDEAACRSVFGESPIDKVLKFAYDAVIAGMDGIVCSPHELEKLTTIPKLKKLLKVTPGIRPEWAATGDQKRFMTPSEAVKHGASHLVIGRPITSPPKEVGGSVEAVKRILRELGA